MWTAKGELFLRGRQPTASTPLRFNIDTQNGLYIWKEIHLKITILGIYSSNFRSCCFWLVILHVPVEMVRGSHRPFLMKSLAISSAACFFCYLHGCIQYSLQKNFPQLQHVTTSWNMNILFKKNINKHLAYENQLPRNGNLQSMWFLILKPHTATWMIRGKHPRNVAVITSGLQLQFQWFS